ncbi:MAG: HalOD1 output domain-containing protein [Haloarculaceae archaeon]
MCGVGVTSVSMGETIEETTTADVVGAVAAAVGTDSRSLEPPLYEVVDPDALEAVLNADGAVTVKFEYAGRSVVAQSDGTVTVDGTEYERPARTEGA